MVVESRSVIRNAKNARGLESCASYFRFTRFNTFPLYYLRAWHRLVKLREARREYKNLIRGHLESVSFYELQGRFARRQCARTGVDSPDFYLSFFKPQKRNKLE